MDALMIRIYFLCIFAVWSLLIFRISTVPENHTGFPIWILYLLGPAGLVLIGLNWRNKGLIAMIGAATVIHLSLLFGMTQTNTLMNYEAWIAKKMPDRPVLLRKILGQKIYL
jgi:prepilin signal peptidase PulO-like enzyme (type II secretory pathway)